MISRGVMSHFQQDAASPPSFVLPEYSDFSTAISVGMDPQRPLLVKQASAEDVGTFRQQMLIPFTPLNTIENRFFRTQINVPNGIKDEEEEELHSPVDANGGSCPDVPISSDVEAPVTQQVLPPFLHRFLKLDFPLFKKAQRLKDQFNEMVARYSRKDSAGNTFRGFWPKLHYLETSAVRALSYHPHETTLAFADGNSNVVVTSCVASLCGSLAEETPSSVPLRHAQQVDIVGLFWDYYSKRRLGVVCLRTCLVWNLEGRSSTSPQVPQLILSMDVSSDIFTAALFTSSLTLLVSTFHGRLREYDHYGVDTERRLGYDCILDLRLSPDGKLVGYSTSNGFLGVLFEDSLDSIVHLDVGSTVSSWAFLPDSSSLVFTKRNSLELFFLAIPPLDSPLANFYIPTVIATFTPASEETEDSKTQKALWEISGLALNDAGSHLILALTDRNGSVESRCLISIMSNDASGQHTVRKVSGWVLCGRADRPFTTDFVHQKSGGDLLSVATKGGCIFHLLIAPVTTADYSWHSISKVAPRQQLLSGNMVFLFLYHVLLPSFRWIASFFMANTQERHLDGFSADISNMSFPTIATPYKVSRITSFVDSKAENPLKDRLYEDILSRGMASVGEAFQADGSLGNRQQNRDQSPLSDHHMSVDRTPEVPSPHPWKNAFSPLAQQLGNLGLKSNGGNSSPPASLLQRINSVGKGSPKSILLSPKLVFGTDKE
ncbi:hypothetical protein RvY_17013 [Ramazzottius varieornatus]|uniref:Uncharacterized protein n=1 Tax=Ramazzottius varieornatus TaxID=947166 RepID=A0A1D1W0L9_RAMVA|nr:hypothetical protein RvY_17013 [Ramazzottius varieornatus]